MMKEDIARLEEKMLNIQKTVDRIEYNIEKMQNFCVTNRTTCEQRFDTIELNVAVSKTKLAVIIGMASLISSTIAITLIKTVIA